jgi:hypothetical protein
MMMIIPSDWQALLRRIQQKYPHAILAGGALRDLDNQREVKDLDIFIVKDEKWDALEILSELIGVKGTFGDKGKHGSDTLDALSEVYDFRMYPPGLMPPVQVIEMSCAACEMGMGLDLPVVNPAVFLAAQLERFDIGLCQIGWDGTNIQYTQAYTHDKVNKTLTVMHNDTYGATINRVIRIHAKYPDFTVVDKYNTSNKFMADNPEPF